MAVNQAPELGTQPGSLTEVLPVSAVWNLDPDSMEKRIVEEVFREPSEPENLVLTLISQK